MSILLSLVAILAISGCRSRKPVAPPATTPPVITATTAPEPSIPVEVPEIEFAGKTDEPPFGEDINEANRIARERGWIRDAFFGFDASTLDGDAQEALQQSATWLRAHPEYRIRIEGHCDNRGTEQYNLALGDRRADTAASYLSTLGIDRTRIETVSYGEERPFEEGDSETAWAQNRRAHLVLVKR